MVHHFIVHDELIKYATHMTKIYTKKHLIVDVDELNTCGMVFYLIPISTYVSLNVISS